MRRRGVLVAGSILVGCLLVGALSGWWLTAGRDPAPEPSSHPRLRLDLLAELRDRLVPSAAGGWVVASPAEPWLQGWLLAASQADRSQASFDQALAQAERDLAHGTDDDPDGRSLALVLAEVLPGPGSDPGRADRLARTVRERATAHLDDGDAGWLAVQIQLSAGPSPAADGARRDLAVRAGAVGCDRLPPPGQRVPAPGSSMTVALRVLAADRSHCEGAAAVLGLALDDPAWGTWVAASELADLAAVAGPLPASTRRVLAEHLRRTLAVRAGQSLDLGALVQVRSARRRLGLAGGLPSPLRRHLAGQVEARGGLPGRSTAAPTAFDVAVLRQLARAGLVPAAALRDTAAVRAWPPETDAPDPVIDALLAGQGRLRCADAPAPAATARVTLVGLIADQTGETIRQACGDHPDVAGVVRRLRAGPTADQQAVRIAVAELTACRLDPTLLADVPGLRLRVSGPFASDPVIVWARSFAADPVAACAAAVG